MTVPAQIHETRVDPGQWAEHVPLRGAPQIIVGGPGTGKTQFLAERVAWAVREASVDPERIVALTFSRRAVRDMERRLVDLLGATALRIRVATYHSIAMGIVEAHFNSLGWARSPTILTAAEQEHYAAQALAAEDRAAWPAGYRMLLDSPVMAAEVTDFMLRCHEQLLSPDDISTMGDPRFSAMAGFIVRYNARLTADNRTDYGRILSEAVTALTRWPETAAAYELVVADEYQDTSPAHAEIAFLLAAAASELVVAADPYQSIYSFRGSDITNVFSFPQLAKERLGTMAERLVLTTSHRVPSDILDAAVSVTRRALPGGAGRVASTRSGGFVASHVFPSVGEEAEWIAADIERAHLLDGVPLERIAVFMRSRSGFSTELAAALGRRALPHSFSASRLADQPTVRFVHNLVIAASDDAQASSLAMRHVLMSPFIGLTYGAVNEMARAVGAGSSWPVAIRTAVPDGDALANLIEDTSWSNDMSAARGLWQIWSTLPQLTRVALDPKHTRDRTAWSAFHQVLMRLAERSPSTTLADHAALARGTDFEADPLYAFTDDAQGGVAIGSLHDAKGTEYDVVYVANAVEGALPDLRSRDSLLGTRLLSPHLPTDPNDYVAFRLDEERRLAYTATTRATSRVVWTASTSNDPAAGGQPSRFLPLIAPPTTPSEHHDPLTARSFEAALRRTARDPLAPITDRLAALEVLALGTAAGLADPLTRYGTRARGSDEAITPTPIRLSPSQAERYYTCPRMYAVSQFLLTRPKTTDPMRFGNLIHRVLELVERAAASTGREHASYEEALAVLDDLWEDEGFGDNAIGMSWKQRAEQTLAHLYAKWPKSGEPVAFERTLEMQIGGIAWRGKADRIEQRGTDLVVVDYKTSATAVNRADASESIQLGFYLLAATQDRELAQLGQFTGAEFWYPRQDPNKDSIVTRSFDMELLDDVRTRLEDITEAIVDARFPPIPGSHCARCDVALVCPARDEGQEAFTR